MDRRWLPADPRRPAPAPAPLGVVPHRFPGAVGDGWHPQQATAPYVATSDPRLAAQLQQTDARFELLRNRVDVLIDLLHQEREERRRDMQSVHAVAQGHVSGSSHVRQAWSTFITTVVSVLATALATYLVNRWLTNNEKPAPKPVRGR